MKLTKRFTICAAVLLTLGFAGCNGGGNSLSPGVTAATATHATMTAIITRDAARTTASVTREILTIPATTKSIEVLAYAGSLATPAPSQLFALPSNAPSNISTCVDFPADKTSITVTADVPLGPATVVINARSGACNANSGTGTIVSQAVGTGTATVSGGDLAATFFGKAAGGAISLLLPGTIAGTPAPFKGATESIAKNVSAAVGGTITLPSGSSLVIKPGALKKDVAVQLALIPNSGVQPNNTTFRTAGATVRVGFYHPHSALPSAEYRAVDYAPGYRRSLARDKHAIAAPMFVTLVHVASAGEFSENAFSLPMLKIYGQNGPVDISAPSDAVGNVDAAITIPIPDPAAIASFALATAGELFDPVTVYDTMVTKIPGGTIAVGLIAPGLRYYDPKVHKWGLVPVLLQKPVHPLLLLHGILSSVSAAYEDSSANPVEQVNPGNLAPDTVETLRRNGGYDAVFGFDYNWLDTPEHVAPQIAQAINAFNLPRLDIVAHSYGTVMAMATIPLLKSTTEIPNLVLYNGPLNGAVLAPGFFESTILNLLPSRFATLHTPDSGLSITTDYLDIYVPGNARLAAIRKAMLAAPNAPQRVIKIAGDTSFDWERSIFSIFDFLYPGQVPNLWDGIVPIESARYPEVVGQEAKNFPKGMDFGTEAMTFGENHTGIVNNPAYVQRIQSLIHVKLNNANPYSNAFSGNPVLFMKGKGVFTRIFETGCSTASVEPATLLPFYTVSRAAITCENSLGGFSVADPYLWIFRPLQIPTQEITSTPTASTKISIDGGAPGTQIDLFTIPDCTTCSVTNLQDFSRTISDRLGRTTDIQSIPTNRQRQLLTR